MKTPDLPESAEREMLIGYKSVVHIDNIVSGCTKVIYQSSRFICGKRIAHILAACKETAAVEIEQSRSVGFSVFIGIYNVKKAVRVVLCVFDLADKILSVFFQNVLRFVQRFMGVAAIKNPLMPNTTKIDRTINMTLSALCFFTELFPIATILSYQALDKSAFL